MISKYLNPQNDFAFRKIFGREKNKDILLAMINSVLADQMHKEVVDIQFLKTNQDPDTAAKKYSIVDVLCKDQDGCQFIIEMQVAYQDYFKKRVLYYACKAYVDQAGEGEEYQNLKKVLFLAFTNFTVFVGDEDYKAVHKITNPQTQAHDIDGIIFKFVDLPKFMKQRGQDIDNFSLEEKFYYFLAKAERMKDDELDKLAGKDIVIRKAFKEIDYFNLSDEDKREYDAEQKRIKDNKNMENYKERKAEQIGRQKERKELLDKMVKQGMITQEQADAML